MLQLDLTPEERDVLIEVLDNYVSDLRMEIVDTDYTEFKDKLRHRKQVVNKVLDSLRAVAAGNVPV